MPSRGALPDTSLVPGKRVLHDALRIGASRVTRRLCLPQLADLVLLSKGEGPGSFGAFGLPREMSRTARPLVRIVRPRAASPVPLDRRALGGAAGGSGDGFLGRSRHPAIMDLDGLHLPTRLGRAVEISPPARRGRRCSTRTARLICGTPPGWRRPCALGTAMD